jgi:glycosyltransferase involved in cell wall biosynthesis
MTALVSVVMLSYNHAAFLPAAIESVLAQTLQDVELIIADDGSSDESLEVAQAYASADSRIKVLTHPGHVNLGIGATANLARSAARGEYLLGLPSDDVLYSDTLEREVDYLEAHPRVGYVYGYAHVIDEHGGRVRAARTFGIDLTADGRIVERLVQGNAIPAMTLMFRRECLQQAGEEDEELIYSDWEFFTRAAAHWEVGFIPRALAMYRLHSSNTSLNASHEVNVDRALQVTARLRGRAPEIGGRLADARVRAALELQMGFLRFASRRPGAEDDIRAAFDRDPSLAGDVRWLGDWLWSRLLDGLLGSRTPEFVSWFSGSVSPLLEPTTLPSFRRELVAAKRGARAIQLGRAGRWVRAHVAALTVLPPKPNRLADRRLAVVLLDSIGHGLAAKAVRSTKRHVLRHR